MTPAHLQRSVHAGGSSPRLLRPPPYHAVHPFPRHFLVRPTITKHTATGTITTPGPMVPLIAVDQLPEWIDIAGVPRELSVEQTMGLHNLGSVVTEADGQHYYEVRLHQDVRFTTSSTPSTPSATPALKRRPGGEARDGKNNSASVDPFDTDLLGSVSSGKQNQKKHGDVVTVVDGSHERRGSNMTYIDDSTSSGLNSSSETASYSSYTETPPSNTRTMKTSTMANKGKEKAAKVSKTETANSNSKPDRGGGSTSTTTARPAAMALNPRLPSPPPLPTVPINPYPLLRHVRGEPGPPAHHPASRLLSAISSAPAPVPALADYPLYSPSHPQQPAAAPVQQHKSQSARHLRAIVHCRHWCHHGSCKYGPECRYEHEMPRTFEGLREIGLGDLPNWYKAALEMARDMQQQQQKNTNNNNNGSRRANKGHGKRVTSSVDLVTTAMMMGDEGGGGGGGGGGSSNATTTRSSRRKVSSSSHPKTRDGSSSSRVAVANDRLPSPPAVGHTANNEKPIIMEERFGRLASVESGDESDGSHCSSSARQGNRELDVQQTPVAKKQDMAEDITASAEKLVDI